MDEKLKHLEFIQGIVNRLASASFRMKGWSVVLVSALLVLLVRASPAELGIILVFPVLMFWALDAYFLSRERLFRKLYDRVRKGTEGEDTSRWMLAHSRVRDGSARCAIGGLRLGR